ncbi:hypothetical protein BDAP_000009 [Binucleata daphniae]
MYRSRFTEILDNLRHEYDLTLQENLSLKTHIKDLEDKIAYQLAELKQTKSYVKELNYYITNIRKIPIDLDTTVKKIKMGSDWYVEGEEMYDVRLEKQKNLYHNIQSVEISDNGNYIGVVVLNNVFIMKVNIKHSNTSNTNNGSGNASGSTSGSTSSNSKNSNENTKNYTSLQNDNLLYYVNSTDDLIDLLHNNLKNFVEGEISPKMCYSKDSKHLYTTVKDRIIRKWNLEENKLVKKVNIKEDIFYMQCSDDMLVTLCKDAVIRIFNEDKMREIPLNIKNTPVCMKIHKNYFYIAMTDKKMVMFNLQNDELKLINLQKNIHHFDVIDSLILCNTTDDVVGVYNIDREYCELKNEKIVKTKGRINFVSFIDEKHVILGSYNSQYQIVNLEDEKNEIVSGNMENLVVLTEKYFCTASTSGMLRLWSIQKIN